MDRNKLQRNLLIALILIVVAVLIAMWLVYFWRMSQNSPAPVNTNQPSINQNQNTAEATTTDQVIFTMAGFDRKTESGKIQIQSQLKVFFASKYNWNDVQISFWPQDGAIEENHIRGSVTLLGRTGSDNNIGFLLAKENNQWLMVHEGGGSYTCQSVEKYNFSMAMIADCLDENNPGIPQIKEALKQTMKSILDIRNIGNFWLKQSGDYVGGQFKYSQSGTTLIYDIFAAKKDNQWAIVVLEAEDTGYSCDKFDGYSFPADMITNCIDNSANWQQYSNEKLGFSLKIPKQTNNTSQENVIDPVIVLESGNVVYITYKSDYNYQSVLDNISSNKTDIEKTLGIPWAILVKPVKNDAELDKFLKDRYGIGCSLGEKTLSKVAGVYDVKINGDGKDLGETKCPINFIVQIKYSPSLHKVAAWDIGQDVNFTMKGERNVDFIMSDTFKFTK